MVTVDIEFVGIFYLSCSMIMKSETYTLSVITCSASQHVLQVNNRNTRTGSEICSKLTIKIPERRH